MKPKLRFKEFCENWEEKRLGDIMNSFDYGMNSASMKFDGENKYIRITDIDENTHRYLNENRVSPSGELDDKYIVKKNDILFARTGASTGKTYLYNEKDGKLYFAGFLIRGNVKENYDSYFVYSQTLTENYNKWVSLTSIRSGQPGINSNEYSNYKCNFPSLPEQIKIADFLSTVDKKIQNQQDKITHLENIKKGFIQNIFSRKIRFKDDEGNEFPNWKEKKLAEFMIIPNKEKVDVIDNNKLLSVKLHLEGIEKNKNTSSLKLGSTIYYKRKSGQFIYGKQNFFNGAFGIIPNELDGFLSSGDVPSLDIKEKKIIPKYLMYYMGRKSFYKAQEKLSAGTGSKRIHENTLLNIIIKIPCLEEQQKIADFLSSFDEKIDTEKETLDHLKELKKGLLQQMFV